jgi:hypothetical protein
MPEPTLVSTGSSVFAMIEDGGAVTVPATAFKYIQIGSSFGSPENVDNTQTSGYPTIKERRGTCNSVIRVGRRIYAQSNDEIYMYDMDDPSSDWTLIYVIPNVNTSEPWVKSGLYLFLLDGIPHIGGFSKHTDGSRVNIFRIDTTTNVGTHLGSPQLLATGATGVTFITTYFWNNRVWLFQNGNNIAWVDLVHGSYNSVTWGTIDVSGTLSTANLDGSFHEWNGDLYAAFVNGGIWTLHRYNALDQFEIIGRFGWWGGGPVIHNTLGPGQIGNFGLGTGGGDDDSVEPAAANKSALWIQDGKLHFAYVGFTSALAGDVMCLTKVDYNGGAISSIIPSSEQLGNGENTITISLPGGYFNAMGDDLGIGGRSEHYQYYVLSAQDGSGTDGSGADVLTRVYLKKTTSTPNMGDIPFHSHGPGGIPLRYAENELPTPSFEGGSPRGAESVLPRDTSGGAARLYIESATAQFTFQGIDGNLQRFGFIILGDLTSEYSFKIYYSIDGSPPTLSATLTNPSAGTFNSTDPNCLTGLESDVEYFVSWDAQTDGITELARVRVVGEVI